MSFKKKLGLDFIVLSVFLIIANIIDLCMRKTLSDACIVFNIFFAFTFISQYIKYQNLKKRGIVQHVRFVLEEKFHSKHIYRKFFAYIKDENGKEYEVCDKDTFKCTGNTPEKGYVDVIVDPKNIKNYYILLDTMIGE